MGNVHVFSKMASSVQYVDWIPGGADLPTRGKTVLIKGGAGVATKNLITPLGVHTEVTEEEAGILKRNHVFQLHLKNGSVVMQASKADPEKVVPDMGDDDPSAPLTPADFADEKKPRVKAK